MLYKIHNGAVKFAATTVLEHINFEIRDHEKRILKKLNPYTQDLNIMSKQVDMRKIITQI